MTPREWEWVESILDSIPPLNPPVTKLIQKGMTLLEIQASLLGVLWAYPSFSTLNLFSLVRPHGPERPNTLTVENWHRNPATGYPCFGDVPGIQSERTAWRAGPHVVLVRHPLFSTEHLGDFRAGALYVQSVSHCDMKGADYELLAYMLYMFTSKPPAPQLCSLAVDLGVVQYLPWMLDFSGYVREPIQGQEDRYIHASPWAPRERLDCRPTWTGTFPLVQIVSDKAALRRASIDPVKAAENPNLKLRRRGVSNLWVKQVRRNPAMMGTDELLARLPTMKNVEVRELIIDCLNWRKPILDLQKRARRTCSSLLDVPIIRVTKEGASVDG